MQITLNHDDVITAIEEFVARQGIQTEGKGTKTTVTCGRGAAATSATIELVSLDSLAAGTKSKPKKTKAKTKKAKPPKENTVPIPASEESEASVITETDKEVPVTDSEVLEGADVGVEAPPSPINGTTNDTTGLFDE